jgi:predicted O-methyltransferase YrrM
MLLLAGSLSTATLMKADEAPQEQLERAQMFEDFLTNMPSAWKGHRNFAEWLVGQMKPQQIVDLGVDYGFSTFVFTNAAEKIGTGMVTGIDSFEGEGMTGLRNTYEYVLEIVRALAFQNVEIIRGDFNSVSANWQRTIDILHIDGYHSYEAVSNDFHTWSPFVADDGVVLFHDINVPNPAFGVIRFFRELTEGYRLYFLHSYGLGIYTKNQALYRAIKEHFADVSDFAEKPF